MNEQRQRRFRTAKDYESRVKAQRLLTELTHEEKENEKKKEREREAAEKKGTEGEEQSEENATGEKSDEAATPIDYPSPPFDSNCISSGTVEFCLILLFSYFPLLLLIPCTLPLS
jgi:5'-3' exonuclease